jgi:hypothetical protein
MVFAAPVPVPKVFVRLAPVPSVVAPLEVSVVNAAVEGVVPPRGVEFTLPPVIVKLEPVTEFAPCAVVPPNVVLPLIVFVPPVTPIVFAALVPVPNVFVRLAPVPSVVAPFEASVVKAPVLRVVAPTVVELILPPVMLKLEPVTELAPCAVVPPKVVFPLIVFVPPATPIVLAAPVPVPNVFVRLEPVPSVVAPLLVSDVKAPLSGLLDPIVEFVSVSPERLLVNVGVLEPPEVRT